MELNKFFENLSNGAKWDVGVGINRTNKLPLDASSVFSSKTAAENYAKGIVAEGQTANAYPGMILSVVEEAETVIYYIDANMELQPVGNTKDVMAYIGEIPETADADTIIEYINKKTEGIATDAALEQLQASVNGILTTLVGDPDDDTDGLVGSVAANTQAIADERAARETAIGRAAEGETAATGVYLAIANALQDAKDYADEQDADTIYDDTALAARVKAIEDDYLKEEDKYDDTVLAGRVTTAEGKIADLESAVEAIDYVDSDELNSALSPINTALDTKATQTDLEALEGRVDAFLTGTGATDALDSLQELITYINEHDDVELADIIADVEALQTKVDTGDQKVSEYVTAAIDALKIGDYAKAADLTALAGRVEALEAKPFDTYATKSEVEAKVSTEDYNTDKATFAVASEVADTYATKDELEAVSTTATNAATKTYVDEELAKKANANIVYTKSEIDLKIGTPGTPEVKDSEGNVTTPAVAGTGVFASTYSKAELNALLDEIEGGSTESAASVARQLETYISTNNERVSKIETKDTTQDTAIAAAQAQADLGVTNAAAAQSTANEAKTLLTALETNKVDKNTTDIAAIQGQITGANGLSARIGALEATDTQHATEFANLKAKVDTAVDTTIPAISGNVSKNATAITQIKTVLEGTPAVGEEGSEGYIPAVPGLVATVDTKANSADVYTKAQVDAKIITSGEVVHGAADQVTIANNKITVTVNSYTKAEVDNLLANLDQTELENGIAANAADIAALVGTDKDAEGKIKSVRSIAKEEVALVVGAAPEALDTLEEVASWIANDQSGAAAMANDIAANKAILAGFGTEEGQPATVLAAIESAKQEAIAAIPALEVATVEKLGGVKSIAPILDEDGQITNAATIENKIAVAADGSMEVNSLNVNKLTQTTGDVLVLDGGSAKN